MIPAEVDAVLAEPAELVTGLIDETAHAERELDTRSLESERFVEVPEQVRKTPNPRRALASVREELAANAARVLQQTEAATETLARYAQTLTTHLPTIRAAASTQR